MQIAELTNIKSYKMMEKKLRLFLCNEFLLQTIFRLKRIKRAIKIIEDTAIFSFFVQFSRPKIAHNQKSWPKLHRLPKYPGYANVFKMTLLLFHL